jgi:isopenicillin N synthase-like dioxygenase
MIRQFYLPDLVTAARAGHTDLLAEFDAVCSQTGAFALTGLPITEDVLAEVYQQTLAFFHLPQADKEALRDPGGNPYIGWDGPAADSEHDSAKRKQMFHIGPRISPSLTTPGADGLFGEPAPDPGSGLWPEGLPAFTAAWHAYYRQMQDAALLLGEVMAATLAVPLEDWRALTAGNWADLAANYYPAARDGDTGSRNAVHSDDTLFTILYQDDGGGGGLRMQHRDGHWVDVPPIADTYLVNIGALLTFLTADRWWAVPHEVTAPVLDDPATRTARVSIPFFFRPNDDRALAPFATDDHSTVLMSEWLLRRRAATPA